MIGNDEQPLGMNQVQRDLAGTVGLELVSAHFGKHTHDGKIFSRFQLGPSQDDQPCLFRTVMANQLGSFVECFLEFSISESDYHSLANLSSIINPKG